MTSLCVRISDSEKEELRYRTKESGLNLSEYCRQRIFAPQQGALPNQHTTIESWCSLFTSINQAKISDANDYIASIEKEAITLWQRLSL